MKILLDRILSHRVTLLWLLLMLLGLVINKIPYSTNDENIQRNLIGTLLISMFVCPSFLSALFLIPASTYAVYKAEIRFNRYVLTSTLLSSHIFCTFALMLVRHYSYMFNLIDTKALNPIDDVGPSFAIVALLIISLKLCYKEHKTLGILLIIFIASSYDLTATGHIFAVLFGYYLFLQLSRHQEKILK